MVAINDRVEIALGRDAGVLGTVLAVKGETATVFAGPNWFTACSVPWANRRAGERIEVEISRLKFVYKPEETANGEENRRRRAAGYATDA